jgi:hypothetical protein
MDDRVTASVVLGPESAVALPGGVSSSDPSSREADPKATLIGMASPTLDPQPAQRGPVATATIPDLVRRGDTTNTQGPDTIATPMNGTEALFLSGDPAGRANVALGEASTELQWPLDRAPVRSEEPQVRSLPVIGSSRVRARPAALVLLAGLGVGAIGATIALGAHRSAKAPAAEALPSVATVPPAPGPAPETASTRVAPARLDVLPAPPPASAPAQSAAPVASTAPVPAAAASTAPAPSSHARPASKARGHAATASSYAPDRPGPGF